MRNYYYSGGLKDTLGPGNSLGTGDPQGQKGHQDKILDGPLVPGRLIVPQSLVGPKVTRVILLQ